MATPAGFDAGVPMPHSSCMSYANLITIDPARRSGKPCARDTRITVYDMLDYLASGMTAGEIVEAFPELTQEDIRACLAFAVDCERRLLDVELRCRYTCTNDR